MGRREHLRDQIRAAAGRKRAPLVLKSAKVLNVFTEELMEADVAICGGCIVGLGDYDGEAEVELAGKVVCPGFIDGHIHLESSMVSPEELEQVILPHGTTAVVTDPHEIANVAGTDGIDYMMEATEGLKLDVFFMLPSCVPATGLDESGAELGAKELERYYGNERVLGLAELMNAYGTVQGDGEILQKVCDAQAAGKLVDGHAPGLSGKELDAYVTAGVQSDHECSDAAEAIEKLRRGQWVMIRQGTAAKNLEALMPLCGAPYYQRCMFVTDDKHPGDLLAEGHIDGIIRRAVALGADPIRAVKMGSFYAARYFGLRDRGAVAPGYRADLVVLSDLETMTVHSVYKDGVLVAEEGRTVEGGGKQADLREKYPQIYRSFHLDPVTPEHFRLEPDGAQVRVIWLVPGELLTEERIFPREALQGGAGAAKNSASDNAAEAGGRFAPCVDPGQDVVKMAVLERHKGTGHIGLGFLGGYGLKRGAVATSVAHDSHNLTVAGVCDEDMALAAETVRKNQGGLAVVADGKVLGELPLPIGGLMTPEPAARVEERLKELKAAARNLGVPETVDPFMTLAFVSLPVIPKLRLNSLGLIDAQRQKLLPVTF